jgi:glycosyltransferase involved in cell wall biosynthesis
LNTLDGSFSEINIRGSDYSLLHYEKSLTSKIFGMPIKVVSIVTRMNLGGVAMLLAELHEKLPSKEFVHTLITGECAQNEIDILGATPDDPNIIKISKLGRSVNFLADFSTFLELRKTIKEINPNIVHTHTSKAGLLGRIAAKSLRRKIKIVHTFHGHHLYGYFPKIIVRAIILIEKMLAKITDLLISDSKQVMVDLKLFRIGAKQTWEVIAPGIRIMPKTSCSKSREKLKISEDLFVICWVGRFTDIKNPMLALRSYSQVCSQVSNSLQLIMVGDGELLDSCKNFAINNELNVLFTGWETNISDYLEASNILLMTSRNEGFGLVIAEAGYFSVPAVSTDVGGVREFVNQEKNGFIVNSSEFNIASKISILIRDPKLLFEVGEEARKTTISNFTAEIFVEKHRMAYRNLSSKASGLRT